MFFSLYKQENKETYGKKLQTWDCGIVYSFVEVLYFCNFNGMVVGWGVGVGIYNKKVKRFLS